MTADCPCHIKSVVACDSKNLQVKERGETWVCIIPPRACAKCPKDLLQEASVMIRCSRYNSGFQLIIIEEAQGRAVPLLIIDQKIMNRVRMHFLPTSSSSLFYVLSCISERKELYLLLSQELQHAHGFQVSRPVGNNTQGMSLTPLSKKYGGIRRQIQTIH